MKNFRSICATVVLIGCTSIAIAQQEKKTEPSLKIGDPAPAVKVMKWAKTKGNEVARFEPGKAVSFERGKVYVVEFWALWCGPCKASMPHLSEVARRYAGKVTVMSMDVRENGHRTNPNYAPKVQAFVDQKGDVMDYNVGIDGDSTEAAIDIAFLKAANHDAIPHAYVISKDGRLAWEGHPLHGMEDALDLALADKLDLKTSEALMKAQQTTYEKWRDLRLSKAATNALQAKDFKKAKAVLDEMDKVCPGYEIWTRGWRYELLANTDPQAAHELAEKHFKQYYRHDPELLEMATLIINIKDVSNPDYAMALKMLERVKEFQITPSPRTFEMIAKAYAKMGDFAKATANQEECVKLTKPSGRGLEDAQKQLEEYKAGIKN